MNYQTMEEIKMDKIHMCDLCGDLVYIDQIDEAALINSVVPYMIECEDCKDDRFQENIH